MLSPELVRILKKFVALYCYFISSPVLRRYVLYTRPGDLGVAFRVAIIGLVLFLQVVFHRHMGKLQHSTCRFNDEILGNFANVFVVYFINILGAIILVAISLV